MWMETCQEKASPLEARQPALWMLFPQASEDYEASFLSEQYSWAAIVFGGLELTFGHQEDIGLKLINNLNLGQGHG